MGKWIDTDAAYAVLTAYYHHSTDTQHAALREALGQVESVDAVPVVRCKDCTHWSGRKYNVHINGFLPWCRFSALQREANDYCSYGERKGGEHETD